MNKRVGEQIHLLILITHNSLSNYIMLQGFLLLFHPPFLLFQNYFMLSPFHLKSSVVLEVQLFPWTLIFKRAFNVCRLIVHSHIMFKYVRRK